MADTQDNKDTPQAQATVQNSQTTPDASETNPEAVQEVKPDSAQAKTENNLSDIKTAQHSIPGRLFGRFKLRQKKKSPNQKKTLTDAELADELYQRIASVRSSEYFMFKLRKRTLLILLGVVIAILWLFALWKYWQIGQITDLFSFNSTTQSQEMALKDGSNIFIRIRVPNDKIDQGKILQEYLSDKGFSAVDLVGDESLTVEGVSVVVKPGDEQIREELSQIISLEYPLTSPSAELATDSDFDAVILFAPDRNDQ